MHRAEEIHTPEQMRIDIKNLRQMLDSSSEMFPGSEAARWTDSSGKIQIRTYSELKSDVLLFVSRFLGDCKGKHIGVIVPGGYEWLVAFLAVVYSGNTAVLTDTDAPAEEIADCLKSADTDLLLMPEDMDDPAFEKLKEQFECRSVAFALYDPEKNTLPETETAYINENEYAVMLFTSGTSGRKKVVPLTHRNAVISARAHYIICERAEHMLMVLPLWHSYILGAVLGNIHAGVCMDFGDGLISIADDLTVFRSDMVLLVPAVIRNIYSHLSFADSRTIGLRNIISGGAPIDAELIEKYCNIGITVANGYGATETFGGIGVDFDSLNRSGSVGKPVYSITEERIVDGEVWIRGGSVAAGYYKDEEATAENFWGEWFRSGDTGHIDEDGTLYITGRRDNLIILANGENVAPEELEQLISRAIRSDDVLVRSRRFGDRECLTALVYPGAGNAGAMADAKAIADGGTIADAGTIAKEVKKINRKLVPYKRIRTVEVSGMPLIRTASGKIVRNQMPDIVDTVIF